MKKLLLITAMAVVSAIALTGCFSEKQVLNIYNTMFSGDVILTRDPQNNYYELIKGLEVHVINTQVNGENTIHLYHVSDRNCFTTPTIQYVRAMGFSEISPTSDYHLYITINKADIIDYEADIIISVTLKDEKGKDLYNQNGIAKRISYSYIDIKKSRRPEPQRIGNLTLDEAYTQALEQINWNRIASYMKDDKPVKDNLGNGSTDLEQTIIRWDIQSRPQGADIFWRVVSKTPEVKSTNNKYLQTTPYEATKAVDIKGLTLETANNVRIVLRCEKDGYLPQEKEYNVRMVLDQEEISAFFRLVKENE